MAAMHGSVMRGHRYAPMAYVQQNQPAGVPPLPLTGERTLPDVPEENYWYRRHLAVYEWIAARAGACGSSTWPAARATAPTCSPAPAPRWSASTPTPRRTSTRALRYVRPNLRFERDLVESSPSPATPSSSCRRSSTSRSPGAILEHFVDVAPVAYVSTPNLLTLAPPGAEKSDNPWHLREYRSEEFRDAAEPHFAEVELLGLFHARKLRAHELAIRLGWDRVHKRWADQAFYDRFTPAIPLRLRSREKRTSTRRWTSSPSAGMVTEPRRARRRPRDRPALATCPMWRASGPIPSARSGCSTR